MKFHIEFIDIVEIDKINVQLMCTYLNLILMAHLDIKI